MNPDLFRGLLILFLALLLCGQALRAQGLRRRAFFFASAGIAMLGLTSVAVALALSQLLLSALSGIGVALLAVGLFFLIRSWRSGELRQEVDRYRQAAAEERARREPPQKVGDGSQKPGDKR